MDYISSKKLYVFSKVVETQSVTKASELTHLTQPAVSNIIRQLELHFNTKLVNLAGKKIHITHCGERLYQNWIKIQSCYHAMEADLQNKTTGLNGKLTIGVVSAAKYFLPDLIKAFMAKNPAVEIVCKILSRSQLQENILKSVINIGFINSPDHFRQVDYRYYKTSKSIFIADANNKILQTKVLTFNHIKQFDFVVRERTSLISYQLYDYFQKNGELPKIKFEIDSTEGIKESIANSDLLALVPIETVKKELAQGLLKQVIIANSDYEFQTRWYSAINHTQKHHNLTKAFLDFIHQTQ